MYCNECGQNNRNDRKFCTNCGASLRDYTKPRENLIMPDEISAKQDKILKLNKINRIISIIMIFLLLGGISSIVATFFIKGLIQTILLGLCLVCFGIYIVLWIINFSITKRKNKTNQNK